MAVLRHVVKSPEYHRTVDVQWCSVNILEKSLRAPGKSLPLESDKNMTSRAFPGESFLEIGVGTKEDVPVVFYTLSRSMGESYT